MHNPEAMTQEEAAALTTELTAIRPDWNATAVMAALAGAHRTMGREQITNLAWAATTTPGITDLADAFKLTPAPVLPPAPVGADKGFARDVAIERLAHALPECFEDLAVGEIVEHQFDMGVRRLDLEHGGPTLALRLLIDDMRAGQATADDLNTALNILETRLCISLTNADDGA